MRTCKCVCVCCSYLCPPEHLLTDWWDVHIAQNSVELVHTFLHNHLSTETKHIMRQTIHPNIYTTCSLHLLTYTCTVRRQAKVCHMIRFSKQYQILIQNMYPNMCRRHSAAAIYYLWSIYRV